MNIGNQHAINKIYRGIQYYDHLPLTSGDLMESSDNSFTKNSLVMNNSLGSGTINTPEFILTPEGAAFTTPLVLLLEGDTIAIHSDSAILKFKDIEDSGVIDGFLCIVGWYQHLYYDSTLRSYGGVNNEIIPNTLLHPELNMQLTTRHQFIWDTVIVDRSYYSSLGDIDLSIANRDESGTPTSGNTIITTYSKINNFRIAKRPDHMDYAESDLYIIPVIGFVIGEDRSTFISLKYLNSLKVNPKLLPTPELKQYRKDIILEEPISSIQDIQVPIGIKQYTIGDTLRVFYEGILLEEGTHYTIDDNSKSITLLQFSVIAGDRISFFLTKIAKDTDSLIHDCDNSNCTDPASLLLYDGGHSDCTEAIICDCDLSEVIV